MWIESAALDRNYYCVCYDPTIAVLFHCCSLVLPPTFDGGADSLLPCLLGAFENKSHVKRHSKWRVKRTKKAWLCLVGDDQTQQLNCIVLMCMEIICIVYYIEIRKPVIPLLSLSVSQLSIR